MSLPNSVQVGPFRYQIVLNGKMSHDKFGECDNDHRILSITEKADAERQVEVLLHEMIHAADHIWGTELKESQVQRLTFGLTQALQDIGWMPKEIER